jgi:hypothetical protein
MVTNAGLLRDRTIGKMTHPTVAAEVSREGGWTAAAIAEVFPDKLAPHLQPYTPDVPAEATR